MKKTIYLLLLFLPLCLAACSHEDEEPMRSEHEIEGIWTDSDDHYMWARPDNRAYELTVMEMEGYPIGRWVLDGFFYEPGYNLALVIKGETQADVYKIVKLTENELVWCWVESVIEKHNAGMSAGEIIGDIIKNAQEGYELDPALYEYYQKISEESFFEMLDSLGLIFPWDY